MKISDSMKIILEKDVLKLGINEMDELYSFIHSNNLADGFVKIDYEPTISNYWNSQGLDTNLR